MQLSTLMQDAAADVDGLFLDDENGFAQTIMQYPGGNAGNPQTVTALVVISKRSVDRSRGKGRETQPHLYVDLSVTLTNNDVWVIGSQNYMTDATDDPFAGMVKVYLSQYAGEFDSAPTKTGF